MPWRRAGTGSPGRDRSRFPARGVFFHSAGTTLPVMRRSPDMGTQSDVGLARARPAPAPPPVARYRAVRQHTEALAAPLSAEDQCIQSMPDASPAKWHRAHTTWFFETFLLLPNLPGYRVFDPRFGFLFNSYYEAAGPRHARPRRGMLTRPSAAEVADYRAHVDTAMLRLLADLPPALAPLVELGLQHEEQHQELLLTDILHALAENPLRPAYEPEWRE